MESLIFSKQFNVLQKAVLYMVRLHSRYSFLEIVFRSNVQKFPKFTPVKYVAVPVIIFFFGGTFRDV